MNIGNKVLINILIFLALAASLYGYFFLRQERSYAENQVVKRTKAFGESMREILEVNLATENLPALKKLLNRIAVFEQPMGMRVILKSGEFFYQTKSLKKMPVEEIGALVSELNQNEISVKKITYQGKPMLVCTLPLESKNGNFLGVLQIFDYLSLLDVELRGYERNLFTALMIFYTLTLAIIFLVIQRNVKRPIASLLKEVQNSPILAEQISKPKREGHELAFIQQEFRRRENHMLKLEKAMFQTNREREALLDQLKQSEKLAAVGKFAAGLAHEMGSPLSVIEGRAAQALKKISEGPLVEKNLNLIVEQSHRLNHMIHDVLTFARRRPLHKAQLDLNRLIHQALELFVDSLTTVEVQKELNQDLPPVKGDPDQILQVFINLIRNALQAMPKGGKLFLATSVVRSDQNEILPWIRISIRDTGIGMDETVKGRLFEPFFSKRSEGDGTGLGLSIVYGIVQEHRGRIVVQSKEEEGSQFDIYLPVEEGGIGRDSASEAKPRSFSEENIYESKYS